MPPACRVDGKARCPAQNKSRSRRQRRPETSGDTAIIRFFICGLCLLVALSLPLHAAEAAPMPLILFNDGLRNPDLKLPRIHPWRAERPGDPFPPSRFILLSVQEGNILRVAMYYPGMNKRARQIDYWNGSGIDVTGLPAAHLRGTRDSAIFGDSLILKPYVRPHAFLGSEEWPYGIWWQRVHGNYYRVIVYRDWLICSEYLMTEKDGQDVTWFLGEGFDTPGWKPFSGYWGGNVTLYPAQGIYTLVPVMEKDLPPDFPEGLVRWIP